MLTANMTKSETEIAPNLAAAVEAYKAILPSTATTEDFRTWTDIAEALSEDEKIELNRILLTI